MQLGAGEGRRGGAEMEEGENSNQSQARKVDGKRGENVIQSHLAPVNRVQGEQDFGERGSNGEWSGRRRGDGRFRSGQAGQKLNLKENFPCAIMQ